MTCKQLGGACDKQFQAETFDQIAEMSKQHGMEIIQKKRPRSYYCNARDAINDATTRGNAKVV